jgi:outer membrane lipoprotein-sorting protein
MKNFIKSALFLLLVSFCFTSLVAEETKLTAVQILQKADDVINAPKDQDLIIKLILIDKRGKEKVRGMSMLQKGSDKRLVKFLSPADQKGIAFLSLPDDVMYFYMPAFKKIRRIASHVKNSKFAGTDFTYEDMEAVRYSDKYNSQFIKIEDNHFLLQLKPKEGIKTDYSKLIMWVSEDNFYITKIEHYNKGDKLFKIMTRDNIEKIGEYWLARESEMQNLKSKHTTKMIIEEVKFDSEFSNDIFTKRNLEK